MRIQSIGNVADKSIKTHAKRANLNVHRCIMDKTPPDSYVINIRAEHTDNSPVAKGFVKGISNKKIIKRYRDYKERYKITKTNNAHWINPRTSISMGDIETGFSGKTREIYDIELTDNQILNIVKNLKKHYPNEKLVNGVLINIINASHQIGYTIMPYKPLSLFGGKTKNNKTKNNKRKNNKSRKNKK